MNDELNNFDPNKTKKPDIWATYAPDRKPNFKIHSSLGLAKTAVTYAEDVILYKLENNIWIEKYRNDLSNHPNKSYAHYGSGIDICVICDIWHNDYVNNNINYSIKKHWVKGKFEKQFMHDDCSRKQK